MRALRGRSVVLTSYLAMVTLAGVLGYVIGAVVLPRRLDDVPVAELGPLSFPITPTTMALYGVAVVAVGLGALLGAVVLVSRRYDEADPEAA